MLAFSSLCLSVYPYTAVSVTVSTHIWLCEQRRCPVWDISVWIFSNMSSASRLNIHRSSPAVTSQVKQPPQFNFIALLFPLIGCVNTLQLCWASVSSSASDCSLFISAVFAAASTGVPSGINTLSFTRSLPELGRIIFNSTHLSVVVVVVVGLSRFFIAASLHTERLWKESGASGGTAVSVWVRVRRRSGWTTAWSPSTSLNELQLPFSGPGSLRCFRRMFDLKRNYTYFTHTAQFIVNTDLLWPWWCHSDVIRVIDGSFTPHFGWNWSVKVSALKLKKQVEKVEKVPRLP